ncbi:MAG: Gram-negative bacterial tonB protein [Syntrophorhabdus sp. PtaU1.Bin002]|nr:MAG: Gram-negative bacterial tonB protein [Syntrophorhabdus sp. PtaB.Bin006]OPY70972.1 MAG: Gram-negative bacterial tonB protein [Syntrophorhabdus sp. PtaU1.Bin002]
MRKILSVHREFVLSLIIHLVVLGTALVFGSQLEKKDTEPVVVFLSGELPGGSGGSGLKELGFQLKKGDPQGKSRKVKAVSRTKPDKSVSIAKAKPKNTETPTDVTETGVTGSTATSVVSQGLPTGTGEEGGGAGGPGAGGFGFGPGGEGGSGGGTGKGHGTGTGDTMGTLRMQYLREHFSYIRDLILKHLKYPHIAKKMGWKGKVVVSFVIRENGSVEKAKILASSGYEILDRQVLTVIREVQPFPKPPVKAELIIPVMYRLE